VRSKKEVRYVVFRLKNPGDPGSEREMIAFHPYLDLAKKHADRLGLGASVDAEAGTYHFDGPPGRRAQWLMEWTNQNLYQSRKASGPAPDVRD
jgi:hypothetical protein